MSIRNEQRLTRTFNATDSRGNGHEIEVWRDYQIDQAPDGSHSESPGSTDYRTTVGVPLKYVAKGRYQVVETGDMLISDDPNAD